MLGAQISNLHQVIFSWRSAEEEIQEHESEQSDNVCPPPWGFSPAAILILRQKGAELGHSCN